MMSIFILDAGRIETAKRATTTRRVPAKHLKALRTADWQPKAGDVILARVEAVGHHKTVDMISGRKAALYAGDEIIVCCGNRYATDQYEALVQDDQWPHHLVAGGGIASIAFSKHSNMREPTKITALGVFCDSEGTPLNVARYALPPRIAPFPMPLIVVAGTSMNSGKTTSAAALIRGLTRSGRKVGAVKVTGTGAGNDTWLMRDAGAKIVLDFTDGGFATTYKAPLAEIESASLNLFNHVAAGGCDAAVVEIADGLQHVETMGMLKSPGFSSRVSSVLFAAYDAMGAHTGVQWLRAAGYDVLGVTGLVTSSELSRREAETVTGLPTFGLGELQTPEIASDLVFNNHVMAEAS